MSNLIKDLETQMMVHNFKAYLLDHPEQIQSTLVQLCFGKNLTKDKLIEMSEHIGYDSKYHTVKINDYQAYADFLYKLKLERQFKDLLEDLVSTAQIGTGEDSPFDLCMSLERFWLCPKCF